MITKKITSDDLRHERTWLLQHGVQDFLDNGMSYQEANRACEQQVQELSDRIDKMEGKV